MISWLLRPPRLDYLSKWLAEPGISVLDVGCGNHSPSKTKKYFPHIRYYGLDKDSTYKLSEMDIVCCENFYVMDLQHLEKIKQIPNDFFGCIIMSHIIEHLKNGLEVLAELLKKLKRNGIIYIETPSERSLYVKDSLFRHSFYNDPSHVRNYSIQEIVNCLTEGSCDIVMAGTRRSLKRIIFLPFYLAGVIVMRRGTIGGLLWDVTGFANIVIAKKR